MFSSNRRLIVALALLIALITPPLIASITEACHAENIALTNQYAGANWFAEIDGYQVSGGVDYSFDCADALFGTCSICVLGVLTFDPLLNGSYSGIGGSVVMTSAPTGNCGGEDYEGAYTYPAWPIVAPAIGSGIPYKLKFYAVDDDNPDGCTSNPLDYDVLEVAIGTTPPD